MVGLVIMDEIVRYVIHFGDLPAGDASRAAASLQRHLHEVSPAIQSKQVRTDHETMDFGAALEVLLAAPAVAELARGISGWLARTHSGKLIVIDQNGTLIADNISSKEAAELARRLMASRDNR